MTGAGSVDFAELERLMELMTRQGIEEFEYERAGLRIRVRKPSAVAPPVVRAMALPEIVVAGPPAGIEGASHEPASAGAEATGGAATTWGPGPARIPCPSGPAQPAATRAIDNAKARPARRRTRSNLFHSTRWRSSPMRHIRTRPRGLTD